MPRNPPKSPITRGASASSSLNGRVGTFDAAHTAQAEYTAFLSQQYERLKQLNPTFDEHFVMAVRILLHTGRPQRTIAAKIGVNPATISRWANGEKLPKRPILRDAYLREMQDVMPLLIKEVNQTM